MTDRSEDARPNVVPATTRNGSPRACEPCRRRKVACDHKVPVCGRCKTNKAPAACFYTPGKSAAIRAPKALNHRPIRHRKHSSLPSSEAATTNGSDLGYMGPSSASTFVQEAKDLLVPLPTLSGDATAPPQVEIHSIGYETPPRHVFDHHDLENGTEVLYCIPSADDCKALLEGNASPVDSWLPSVAVHMCESMWSAYGAHLAEPRSEHTVKQMARRICDQANYPLEETHGSGQGWLSSFSGPNLRWESIGILFALWAVRTAQKMNKDNDEGEYPQDGSADPDIANVRFHGYVKCVESCLRLSRWQKTGNTVMLYLLIKYTHLTSIVHGDASLISNAALADAVSVATKLGIHVDRASDVEPVPFLLLQLRRRLFCHLFTLDKVSSVFSGRPPLLSGRYCSVSLPLDISDHVLLDASGLHSLPPGQIDQNGWNIYDGLHAATVLRARTMMAYIREEILQLILGVGQNAGVDHLLELRERQLRTYASFPTSLLYQIGDLANTRLETRVVFAQILTRLEHLQNLFLIQRLLVRTRIDSVDSMALIATCHEILTVAHDMWTTSSSRMRTLRYSFGWLLVGYVCPAAGLLCGELLTPSSSLHTSQSYPQRSDVVMQLSLLHSFLGAVKADAANAPLCVRAEHLIHHVLQQILNTHHKVNKDARSQEHCQPMSEAQSAYSAFFSLELFDTFDWATDWT